MPSGEDRAAYQRQWTAANPDRAREIAARSYDKNAARHRAARRERFDALKSGPCHDCGKSYPPYVMDFDHRDPLQNLYPRESADSATSATGDVRMPNDPWTQSA